MPKTHRIKPIPGFPGYFVSDTGDVFRKLKPGYLLGGYLKVNLCSDGVKKSRTIHRLVLESFVGARSQSQECRHLDGDMQNNSLNNLCWGTHRENVADTARLGRIPVGAKHPHAKLNSVIVQKLRSRCADGLRICDLQREFEIPRSTIRKVLTGQTWRHVK